MTDKFPIRRLEKKRWRRYPIRLQCARLQTNARGERTGLITKWSAFWEGLGGQCNNNQECTPFVQSSSSRIAQGLSCQPLHIGSHKCTWKLRTYSGKPSGCSLDTQIQGKSGHLRLAVQLSADNTPRQHTAGLVHVRNCVPPPHVELQPVHGLHSPFTAHNTHTRRQHMQDLTHRAPGGCATLHASS